jgi:thiol-disulfide isomerase/thioredoxin
MMKLAAAFRPLAVLPALALCLGGVPAGAASDDGEARLPLTGPAVGAPAPDFALRTLEGKTVSLAAFRGKTLVVNVWATWCPPCRQEMPDLIASARTLQKDGVAFLGVDTTETAPIVRAYVAARGVSYPQALGGAAFSTAYDVQAFPTTYVIDPQGVLRARYIDVLAPAQLASFVAAAKAGRNGVVASPLQAKIDATLADPTIVFTGTPAEIDANAKRAQQAIAAATALLDRSDPAHGNATDYLRTQAESATLRDAAIAALAGIGDAASDKALLPQLRGDAARDRERWTDALAAYRAASAIDPKNADALAGLAFAARRLDDYATAVDADAKLVALDPTDVSARVDLGIAQQKAGDAAVSDATFDEAVAVAQQQIDAHPGVAKDVRLLAWAQLYAGRTAALHGDRARARTFFERSIATTQRLPANDERYAMYLEENQEALVALGLQGAPRQGATVTLAPWTGTDLPGSIPDTIKYRLVVAGVAGRSVALRAADVPKGWVASFCSDRTCAPFRTVVDVPASGVKVVEFQLVPPSGRPHAPKVRVIGRDGLHESVATT